MDRWICLPEPHQVSMQMGTNICSHFVLSAYKNDNTKLFLHVLGSKNESTRSGRTLRGRGSCWERGNLPLWPRRLHPASNRTSERAGATARRTKRKITVNYFTELMVYILLNVKLNLIVNDNGLSFKGFTALYWYIFLNLMGCHAMGLICVRSFLVC